MLFNQRIRVRLNFVGGPEALPLEDFKRRLKRSFEEWHGWDSFAEADDYKAAVLSAGTYEECFDRLLNPTG